MGRFLPANLHGRHTPSAVRDRRRRLCLIGLAVPLAAFAQPALRLDVRYADHMVLQRGRPLAVTGRALPGRTVHLRFGRHTVSADAGPDSGWVAVLPRLRASASPRELLVASGADTLRLRDILVGDLWVCLGQSNMEWPMAREAHLAEELSKAGEPLIRLFNPTYAGQNTYGVRFSDSIVRRLTPERFFEGGWERSDSLRFRSMSAVGWYFARAVVASERVPVGLLNLAVGGAPLEAMTGLPEMASHPGFVRKLQGDWLGNDALPVWVRQRGRQNLDGVPGVPTDTLGPAHAFKPGFIHAAGIRPLFSLSVRGLLCYQGESNAQEADRVAEYPELFVRMVRGLRAGWGDDRLPVYFVQLSSIDTVRYRGQLWPAFRDSQRRILDRLPHSGMAVSADHGLPHDVHPPEKRAVGERLARWALRYTYGRRIVPSGPLPVSAAYRRGRVVVRFRYAPGGLRTSDGGPVRGFSLDGSHPVAAALSGRRAIIPSPVRPAHVHFGWKPFSDANLANREGLPASTFQLDVR